MLARVLPLALLIGCFPPVDDDRQDPDDTDEDDTDDTELPSDTDLDTDPPTLADSDGDGVPNVNDCAPDDRRRYPGATEVCDGIDNDCDGEEVDGAAWWFPMGGTPVDITATFDDTSTRVEDTPGEIHLCGGSWAADLEVRDILNIRGYATSGPPTLTLSADIDPEGVLLVQRVQLDPDGCDAVDLSGTATLVEVRLGLDDACEGAAVRLRDGGVLRLDTTVVSGSGPQGLVAVEDGASAQVTAESLDATLTVDGGPLLDASAATGTYTLRDSTITHGGGIHLGPGAHLVLESTELHAVTGGVLLDGATAEMTEVLAHRTDVHVDDSPAAVVLDRVTHQQGTTTGANVPEGTFRVTTDPLAPIACTACDFGLADGADVVDLVGTSIDLTDADLHDGSPDGTGIALTADGVTLTGARFANLSHALGLVVFAATPGAEVQITGGTFDGVLGTSPSEAGCLSIRGDGSGARLAGTTFLGCESTGGATSAVDVEGGMSLTLEQVTVRAATGTGPAVAADTIVLTDTLLEGNGGLATLDGADTDGTCGPDGTLRLTSGGIVGSSASGSAAVLASCPVELNGTDLGTGVTDNAPADVRFADGTACSWDGTPTIVGPLSTCP